MKGSRQVMVCMIHLAPGRSCDLPGVALQHLRRLRGLRYLRRHAMHGSQLGSRGDERVIAGHDVHDPLGTRPLL